MHNPFASVAVAWLTQPAELVRAWQELVMASLATGLPAPVAEATEGDDRFSDAAWRDNPFFHAVMRQYLALTRTLERQLYDTPGANQRDARSAAFLFRHWCNALAPSNFFFLNPQAMRQAFDTGGASVRRGFENWLYDVEAGDLRMVDASALLPGRDLAATPGRVVLRNRLMELIQYTPTRKQVRKVPLVLVPPWINKYYILDLTPAMSMVRYLVDQGFDVFIISWRNPDAQMRDVTFEDHLFDGILAAIDAARAIAGTEHVHAVGYCIGGTALAALMAWLNAHDGTRHDAPVAHWSLLATLTDFSKPGDIASFIDRDSVAALEALMVRQGYLDAWQIGWSFRLLRPNTQIWRYVVHKYLLGEAVPALAPLAWNADGTRQPYATHAFCLRALYLDNLLAQAGALKMRGRDLDLGRIRQPLYAVGALADHITPWRSTFASACLAGAERFALTSSGHILGIVNPPGGSGRSEYWVGPMEPAANPREWQAARQPQAGSWWQDWTAWLHQRCGDWRLPSMGDAIGDAPGSYVLQKS